MGRATKTSTLQQKVSPYLRQIKVTSSCKNAQALEKSKTSLVCKKGRHGCPASISMSSVTRVKEWSWSIEHGFLPKQCRFDDISMFSMLSTPGWPYRNIIPGMTGDGIGKMPPGRDSDHAEGAEGLQSPDETLQNALTLFHEGAGGHIH